jgi:alpha-tubulin suppressor-like RCC1 family protein
MRVASFLLAIGTAGAAGCGGGHDAGTMTVQLPALTGAVDVTAGGSHACALMSDGTARCWGENLHGQLGDGMPVTENSTAVTVPVAVSALSGIVRLAAGGAHTCALRGDGTAWCWGSNSWGELGLGMASPGVPTPAAVTALTGATDIRAMGPSSSAVDASEFTCALVTGGAVQCWGEGSLGELGNGLPSGAGVSTPGAVIGLTGAAAIAAGGFHACAALGDGTVRCWGDNTGGALGDGTSVASPQPVEVVGVSGVVAVACGGYHTCALLDDGTVECWGANVSGQLGNGTQSTFLTDLSPPAPVVGLAGVTALAAGDQHTCALLGDRTVQCWGRDIFGQVGTTAPASGPAVVLPTPVEGLTDVSAIAAGQDFTCAVLADTTIRCWGANTSGQLGNGATTTHATPAAVTVVSAP